MVDRLPQLEIECNLVEDSVVLVDTVHQVQLEVPVVVLPMEWLQKEAIYLGNHQQLEELPVCLQVVLNLEHLLLHLNQVSFNLVQFLNLEVLMVELLHSLEREQEEQQQTILMPTLLSI